MLKNRNVRRDLAALALCVLVVFAGTALYTYDTADPPGTLVYPQGETAQNAGGWFGALLAHVLLSGLGVGAYYLLFSLAIFDGLLLARRPMDQPVLRTGGWVLSLAGLTTFAALALPDVWSDGPAVGPGGYVGATAQSVLETYFASAGSLILTTSVIVAGLLLCTDYALFRITATSFGMSARTYGYLRQAAARQRNRSSTAPSKASESEEDEWDDEEELEEEDEAEDAELPVRFRGRATGDADEPSDEEEEVEEESDEAEPEEEEPIQERPAARRGVKKRLASALGLKATKQAEREEVIEQLEEASFSDEAIDYELPSIELLEEGDDVSFEQHEKEVRRKAKILEKTFANFGFNVRVVEIDTGPVIAQYEVELEAGLRLAKITSLADDLAIALRVPSVRIVAPIPGKNTVGIEVPNENRQLVRLREVIEEAGGRTRRMKIPVFLGKDVAGSPMVVDLAALPHLLIAGRTGTGKSVCLNSLIVSMLMTRRPDEVRLLLIDPKMVELSPYKTLPHLMHPVVTDMRKAEAILAWGVDKMEERYALLARAGVRHVSVYNQLGEDELRERIKPESEEEWQKIPKQLPFIVIVADEIADLMIMCGKEVEQHIIRLAQKSRAVGIHLILATQKPTVDVITGLIKSNLPARIAFQVASRTDSRVVLDEMGADKLLGNGDMLFLLPGTSMLLRGQGTYLNDDEINRVVDSVSTAEPQFVKELVQLKVKDESGDSPGTLSHRDDLYEAAVDVVVRERRGSVSLLQRALGIGYGRAARLIDYMAEDGIVGEYNGSQAREVTISVEDWESMSGDEPAPAPTTKRPTKILPQATERTASERTGQREPATIGSAWDSEEEDEPLEDVPLEDDADYEEEEYEDDEVGEGDDELTDEAGEEETDEEEYEDGEYEEDEEGEYEDDEYEEVEDELEDEEDPEEEAEKPQRHGRGRYKAESA